MDGAILVTGGAGYIGSHTVRRLLEEGRRVVVADDLSTGHREVMSLFERVYGPDQFCFEEVNLLDDHTLGAVFERHVIVGIIDFAARSLVGESQKKPRLYFEQNVLAFRNLVQASSKIPIVKSSTAATYGNPEACDIPLVESYQEACLETNRFSESQLMPASIDFDGLLAWYVEAVEGADARLALTETDVAYLEIPTNVYGITKMMDERILAKCDREGGRRFVALRYFNAAGADGSRLIGEDHNPETHLIPLVLQVALEQREKIVVFGDDYETKDGTAVRDYISVAELADAHVLSLDYLLGGGESKTFNLGTSTGFSVRQIIEAARTATGRDIREEMGERRSGDPAVLIAGAGKIRQELGWEASETLEETLLSAWHWHRLNPQGYRVVQEERFNPFWGRWVNIAAHRGSRPWGGETQDLEDEAGDEYDLSCYLCPGNRRASGEVNPDYRGVWSFENDFPSLTLDSYEIEESLGPYEARTSRGVCEVVNYGPDHARRLSTMSVAEIGEVVDGWAGIYERLGKNEAIKYTLIFENRGTIMGNSQPHPHGQVYAYSEVPGLIAQPQIDMFRRYREQQNGGCFVCEANRMEQEDGRRILIASSDFIAYVPFAAQLSYDVMVVPRDHVGSLLELGGGARQDFSRVLKHLLVGLDGLFGAPYHYTLALIQAPTDGVDHGYHMQVHITSLLRGPGIRKHIVGADIFGNLINPSDPNVAAEEIRQAMKGGRGI